MINPINFLSAFILATSSECYNIVDDTLELIDPTPDVIELFREYDKIYFSGKLQCCEVKWSSRMTL